MYMVGKDREERVGQGRIGYGKENRTGYRIGRVMGRVWQGLWRGGPGGGRDGRAWGCGRDGRDWGCGRGVEGPGGVCGTWAGQGVWGHVLGGCLHHNEGQLHHFHSPRLGNPPEAPLID